MSFIENIQKIQNLNKSFHNTTPLSFKERVSKIYEIQKLYREHISLGDEDFLNKFIDQTVEIINQNEFSENLIHPTGLIFAFIPKAHQYEVFYQLLILAIASQNPMLFNLSNNVDKKISQFIIETKLIKGFEHYFDFIANLDVTQINQLIQHPGIKGVYYVGQLKKLNNFPSLNDLKLKKVIRTSYKNFAALLGDADLELAACEIARGISYQSAKSPFSIHKIYCLESQWQYFYDFLKIEIEKIENENNQNFFNNSRIETNFLKQIEIDQGKILWQSKNLMLIKDLSNCSVLQQDDYFQSVIILSEHKYQYQIPKYANVSELGQVAYIFGSEEKCKSFVKSLSAEYIVFNKYIPLYDKLLSQRKLHSMTDNNPFGDFFSNKSIIY